MLTEKWLPGLESELINPFNTSLGGAGTQVRHVGGGTLKQAVLAHQLPLVNMMTVFTTIGPIASQHPLMAF